MMGHLQQTKHAAAWLALASLIPSCVSSSVIAIAQQPVAAAAHAEATEIALPLPEDRGAAALEQTLKRLDTWASLMIIIAHPDDEDGSMITYESRGHGVRASQLTLTRGEGGQNAISADAYDALGIIRTNELLRAGQFYGVKQYWGTEADFGFSKTQEEAFAQWGHDRVLYDAVLAIRRERPLVLVSTFVGGVTDGHGQHQVSAAIEQEAYRVAGDPKVFPEQFALGVRPWSPRAVFSRMPFAPITGKGMFDYATGKWTPVKFYNYVTQEWSTKELSSDVKIPTGSYDPVLGRTYTQIAREGWGEQKSQNGGGNPSLSGSNESEYHRWAASSAGLTGVQDSFFAGIPTEIDGLATLVSGTPPDWLKTGLTGIAVQIAAAQKQYVAAHPEAIAPVLKAGFQATMALRQRVSQSQIAVRERDDLLAELDLKIGQFQQALAQSLGLDLQAYTTRSSASSNPGPFGGGIDETSRSVSPGEPLEVRIHTGNPLAKAKLERVWLESSDGHSWTSGHANPTPGSDVTLEAHVPESAAPTEPYFTRPTIEQPYYDVSRPEWRGRSFAPYPLTAWAEFRYEGVPIRMGEVVQTMQRQVGLGGIFEPLVITPKIGIRVSPESQILPLDGSPLPVHVTVHTEGPADGKVRLKLPTGWTATPAEAEFHRKVFGDTAAILFAVKPPAGPEGLPKDTPFTVQAEAESGGHTYESGWRWTGHAGLRPYNLYSKAEIKTRAVDVKMTPGLRVGYVMGTGDTVPEAMEGLGVTPHLLTTSDLMSSDLSAWDVIMLGIRAYSARPELGMVQGRLDAFVQAGGTLIVQYQSNNFPAPFPLTMGRAERVVEESAPVKILDSQDKLLSWPNQITSHDFDGWVEERGHSFLDSWDPAFTALTETADAGQDPQLGGLLVAHPGKGTYIYIAYAIYRQLPELVPGSYRILANLLSSAQSKHDQ